MKTYRWLFLILSSWLVISCSNKDGREFYQSKLIDKNLAVEKIDEFTIHYDTDSDHTLGKIRFTFATNPAGNRHAFYDEMQKQFIITNKKGEIQNIISKEGRGPGEIMRAGAFNLDEQNRLVVFDENQHMIKIFDLSGLVINHSKPEKTRYYISGRKLQAYEGSIISSTIDQKLLGNLREEAYKSKLAAVHSYDGELIDTIGTYDPIVSEAKTYTLSSLIDVDPQNNRLISTHSSSYRVQIYDLDSHKRIGWFGRKPRHFNEGDEYISPQLPHNKIREMSVGRSSAAGIHTLPGFIIVYFETLTESFFETEDFNEKDSYVAVYDDETYDSYEDISLPYILGNVANGKLYLIEDDNPDNFTVGVYELAEEN